MTGTRANQKNILADYAEGPILLEEALHGLSVADLDQSPPDDGWTIRQIVHHLSDGDDIWKSFIKQAVGNPGGEFILEWYWRIPQVEWAARWNYGSRSIDTSLAVIRSNRNQTVQLLEHYPQVLENYLVIRWPRGEKQNVSVKWVLEMQIQHVKEHVNDIRGIRDFHDI